jgi:murein L,D-transpeptidase YcbB/YkuD
MNEINMTCRPARESISPVMMLFLVLLFGSCDDGRSGEMTKKNLPAQSKQVPDDLSVPGSFQPPTSLQFDSLRVPRFFDSFPRMLSVKKDLVAFYRQRQFSYAWFDNGGLIEPAENLFNRILHMSEEGLPEHVVYRDVMMDMMDEARESNKPDPMLELMLTSQYFLYARQAWQGVNEQESMALNWLLPRKKISLVNLLDSLVSGKSGFEKAPVYPQYALLKEKLNRYRELSNIPDWPAIQVGKKMPNRGDSSNIISLIRSRLHLLEDLSSNSGSAVFDEELARGLRAFQKRHGMTEDGKLSVSLIRELNVSPARRLEQIMVNMERCRWIPTQLASHYLVVNIPAFKLYSYQNDSLAWSMNVVVGKAQHKTVIFNGNIKYVVFSPYWNVPSSIVRKEILPAIRKNRNYLQRHQMEWFGSQLRQKPGPNNSLGLVKFLFPNSHSIYLHDTPAKSLFNESARAFSHGCIRLEDARKLAIYLLQQDPDWNVQRIDSAMHAGVERTVTLKKSMPVYIAYFTAWVGRDGKLNFRRDIYDRDKRLLEAILK